MDASQQQPFLPPVWHPLHFDESSFVLFKGGALRQFNLGLGALLECLVELGHYQQARDKTLSMPHEIDLSGDVPTIGGLPWQYNEASTAVDFTRAGKYLLTNLQWLVAHAVKHHGER